MIVAEDLTRRFGELVAVDGVSFTVKEGEIFGLLGPNGAGKTTTVRMLTGLLSPMAGSASVLGYDVSKSPLEVRRSVGVLTETPNLYEKLSLYENLDYFGRLFDIPPEKRKDRIKGLLELLGLWERRNDKAGVLSKGMKQKAALTRALLHNPQVLFLDEPTSGLDPEMAFFIRTLIRDLTRKQGKTVLMCTHNLTEAQDLCLNVGIMSKGKIIAKGSPWTLRSFMEARPRVRVVFKPMSGELITAIRNTLGVFDVQIEENGVILEVDDAELVIPKIIKKIVERGGEVASASTEVLSLEEIYLKLVRGSE